jgi:hypothetical protein
VYPEEVYEELTEAFHEGLIDEWYIDRAFIRGKLVRGKERVLAELQNDRNGLIHDTIRELEWWACFRPVPQHQPASEHQHINQPVRKQNVGRNAPCPCGSGKKYKKCCGS